MPLAFSSHDAIPRGRHCKRGGVDLDECAPAVCPPYLQEMFRQGDREKALGLPVSALMDRSGQGVTKSQPGFFNVSACVERLGRWVIE